LDKAHEKKREEEAYLRKEEKGVTANGLEEAAGKLIQKEKVSYSDEPDVRKKIWWKRALSQNGEKERGSCAIEGKGKGETCPSTFFT